MREAAPRPTAFSAHGRPPGSQALPHPPTMAGGMAGDSQQEPGPPHSHTSPARFLTVTLTLTATRFQLERRALGLAALGGRGLVQME